MLIVLCSARRGDRCIVYSTCVNLHRTWDHGLREHRYPVILVFNLGNIRAFHSLKEPSRTCWRASVINET